MILRLIKYIFEPLENKRRREEEEYLAKSTDLVDLEQRQRKLNKYI
jgi:hypothetical protein